MLKCEFVFEQKNNINASGLLAFFTYLMISMTNIMCLFLNLFLGAFLSPRQSGLSFFANEVMQRFFAAFFFVSIKVKLYKSLMLVELKKTPRQLLIPVNFYATKLHANIRNIRNFGAHFGYVQALC